MSHYYNFMLPHTDNLFEVMTTHMLSDSKYNSIRLKSLCSEEVVETPIEVDPPQKQETNNISFEHDDPLFWCMYVGVYGVDSYKEIKRHMNVIIEEKQKIAKHFENNINALKQHNKKITIKEIKEILSNLLTNTKDYYNMYAYSVYYKRPILIVRNNNILKIVPHECTGDPIVINKCQYVICDNTEIYDNYYELNNFNNPLKSISQFRINELRSLSDDFNLPSKDKTKHEMYNELNHLFEFEKLN